MFQLRQNVGIFRWKKNYKLLELTSKFERRLVRKGQTRLSLGGKEERTDLMLIHCYKLLNDPDPGSNPGAMATGRQGQMSFTPQGYPGQEKGPLGQLGGVTTRQDRETRFGGCLGTSKSPGAFLWAVQDRMPHPYPRFWASFLQWTVGLEYSSGGAKQTGFCCPHSGELTLDGFLWTWGRQEVELRAAWTRSLPLSDKDLQNSTFSTAV